LSLIPFPPALSNQKFRNQNKNQKRKIRKEKKKDNKTKTSTRKKNCRHFSFFLTSLRLLLFGFVLDILFCLFVSPQQFGQTFIPSRVSEC
jgi:intergrase/recombinase